MTKISKKEVLFLYVLVTTLLDTNALKNGNKKDTSTSEGQGCFCKLHGEVDDCSCKVENIDSLNNRMVYPRMKSLLSKNYFRFFKVNLKKNCPFWADDSRCAMRNCAVDVCTEEQLPDGLKKRTGQNGKDRDSEVHEDCDDDLGYLNTTISEESAKAFQNWTKYDDAQETFCEIDDDTSPDMKYVDLLLNPERYTGYKGDSPHRIWNSIYNENCFKTPEQQLYNTQALSDYSLEGLCLEKRAFYRMVSGLHTSINIHLCYEYLFPAATCYGKEQWGSNLEEFQRRFDHSQTDGHGPQWLKNLYFTYLVELRALAKAAPYFEEEGFFTGDSEEDADVKHGVEDLLKVIKEFPEQFDESKLFKGNKKEARALKKEFRDHFLNITRIMDCVGCDKCKLWGKLQVQGMGTALKILFSGDGMGPQSIVKAGLKNKFQLRRTEIVALFNAFGRIMAIGPLCTVVPIQFHRYLSPATLKSYLACDETYGNELRKSVEPADIPVIVKKYSEVVYDSVQKRLNQLGKQAVEALHPWVVNTLVDWDDFDRWICMAAEETQKPNLPNDSPPGYYSTDGNPPCNSSTDDTPPRNSSTGDSPPHNSSTDDSPPATLSESCKAKVSQNEVLQSPSFQWTRPAVLRLIALYKENEAKFQKPAIKKKTVWQEIANKITEHLLPVTWLQCEQKWKNMTKAYRDTIDNNRKSGADRKECPFFKEIGEIYGYRPNVTPLHCEGSMACITAEAGESESSTGSEEPGASTCSSPIKKKKAENKKKQNRYSNTVNRRYERRAKGVNN